MVETQISCPPSRVGSTVNAKKKSNISYGKLMDNALGESTLLGGVATELTPIPTPTIGEADEQDWFPIKLRPGISVRGEWGGIDAERQGLLATDEVRVEAELNARSESRSSSVSRRAVSP